MTVVHLKSQSYYKGVRRSPGVERPNIEAAQWPRIFLPRVARKFLTYLFFTYEETALIASRYIEGHALTLCVYAVTV